MSAQGHGPATPPARTDYRLARRLILIGVLVAVASLLVLLVGARRTPDDSGPAVSATPSPSSSTSTGDPGDGAPGASSGPAAEEPPDSLPGESVDEYRWRARAGDLRQQARDELQRVLDAAAGDPSLQLQLERVAGLMDHEAQADSLRQAARASALSSTSTVGAVTSSGAGAGGLTTVVGLVGALGGMLTAAAGLLTAWMSWRKVALGG